MVPFNLCELLLEAECLSITEALAQLKLSEECGGLYLYMADAVLLPGDVNGPALRSLRHPRTHLHTAE